MRAALRNAAAAVRRFVDRARRRMGCPRVVIRWNRAERWPLYSRVQFARADDVARHYRNEWEGARND